MRKHGPLVPFFSFRYCVVLFCSQKIAERRSVMRLVYSLILLVLLSVSGCSSKTAPEPLWIGQLLPQAAARRPLAQHARQGVEQALAEAHDAEQTIAGRPCAVRHVEGRDEDAAVQAKTVRFIAVNKVVALLADFDSMQTERLVRASRSYGVPVIVPGELPGLADSDAIVSLGVPPAVRGRLLARYASLDLKCQRAAVLRPSLLPSRLGRTTATAAVKNGPYTTAAERERRFHC
jgi:ABC-type branched-subunit amino acid transport system substrate-binding protein